MACRWARSNRPLSGVCETKRTVVSSLPVGSLDHTHWIRSHARPEAVSPVRVPDSGHEVVPAEIVAEDHELQGHGRAGRPEVRLPELETRAEALERGRGDLRCDPEIGSYDEPRDMRRSVVEDLKVDDKRHSAGGHRIGAEGHISDGESSLHLNLHEVDTTRLERYLHASGRQQKFDSWKCVLLAYGAPIGL